MLDSTAEARCAPDLVAGKYRLEREVGRGGMGVVYQATHSALRQRVAIKIVLPELAQNPLIITRMLREARCAAQITSDHVVRVIDVGQLESGQPFIVMEFVEGEDLARRLAHRGPLPLPVAVHALLEACVAVAEAHAKGIVHRDLKPSNLFLARAADGGERIKVLDFGISKQLDAVEGPVTRPNDVMGSPNYMAPEQICTPLAVDARADVWALGTILLELSTGKRAFPGDTITAVYTRVLAGEPDLPEPDSAELPNELVSVVSRCLRKDPGERFQSVHELVTALAPFAPATSTAALRAIARFERTASAGAHASVETATALPSPLASPPASSKRASSLSVRRHRGGVVAGVGLGLVLVLSGALALLTGSSESFGPRSKAPASSASDVRPALPEAPAALAGPDEASAPRAAPTALGNTDAGGPEVRVAPASDGEAAPPLAPRAARGSTDAHGPEAGAVPAGGGKRLAEGGAAGGAARSLDGRAVAPPPGSLPLSAGSRQPVASPPPAAVPPAAAPARNPWDVTTFGGRS